MGEVHAELGASLVGILPKIQDLLLDDARREAQAGNPEGVAKIRAKVTGFVATFRQGAQSLMFPALLPVQRRATAKLDRQLAALEEAAELVRTKMIGGK